MRRQYVNEFKYAITGKESLIRLLPDCIHKTFRFFLEVLYGFADSGAKFRELSPPEKQYDYEQNQQYLAYPETVHSVSPILF